MFAAGGVLHHADVDAPVGIQYLSAVESIVFSGYDLVGYHCVHSGFPGGDHCLVGQDIERHDIAVGEGVVVVIHCLHPDGGEVVKVDAYIEYVVAVFEDVVVVVEKIGYQFHFIRYTDIGNRFLIV